DRPEREYDFKPCANAVGIAVPGHFHTWDAFARKGQPGDQCISEDSKVWPVHVGKSIGTEDGEALAVADPHIQNGCAAISFHHAPIVTFERWDPSGMRPLQHRRRDRVRIGRRLNKHRPSGPTVLWIRRPAPIFDPSIHT